MDEFLKCPWCGDEIAMDDMRRTYQLDCPGCGKSIDTSKEQRTRPARPPGPWKSKLKDGTVVIHIGSCSGTTEAADHVHSFLASHGIWSGTEGSKAYAIFVRENDAGRAKTLLSNDPHAERFHVAVYPCCEPRQENGRDAFHPRP